MVFSNLVFIFVFLPLVLLFYFIVGKKFKNTILLIASLIFYAWGEPKYVFLMLFSILLNYIFGRLVNRYRNQLSLKKLFLTIAIVGNLLILGFFKYAEFVVNNINLLFGINIQIDPIPLPIGISFFTFQAMSYIIDVYRNDVKVQKNILSLSLYISLFPQLVAGPIVRYHTVAEQIKSRFVNLDKFSEGIRRFIVGLAKKVIIANSLGELADMVFATPASELTVTSAWIGVIAYGLQIYFDFSGYSDMAIGLGKMFGFDFLENFNYPYISKSISEFWRRWHISLGSWFRDYVYIPLGGNRKGYSRTIINLLIVWSITGFWHGASWTFMAWGFYFGVWIVIERIWIGNMLSKSRLFGNLYVFIIVMVGWVFFRADDFSYSFSMIKVMFGLTNQPLINGFTYIYLNDYWLFFVIGLLGMLPVIPWLRKRINPLLEKNQITNIIASISFPIVYMAMLVLSILLLVNSTYNPFIYFRF